MIIHRGSDHESFLVRLPQREIESYSRLTMLHYCKTNNFGDDLNLWLWSRMAPEFLNSRDDRLFLGIGTILSSKVPTGLPKFVFGSGWAGERKFKIDSSWNLFGVRGPLTASGLGLEKKMVVSDPGLLVRKYFDSGRMKRRGIGWMPHHRSANAVDWGTVCLRYGIRFIDPRESVDKVLQEISSCELVVSEAMHGAIISDALRVPWIPVRMYSHINEFKWKDWCASLGLTYLPLRLPPLFQDRPPKSKMIANRWKRWLAPSPLGKPKWKLLPVRSSSEAEIDRTLKAILTASTRKKPVLSNPDRLNQMEETQINRLEVARKVWNQ